MPNEETEVPEGEPVVVDAEIGLKEKLAAKISQLDEHESENVDAFFGEDADSDNEEEKEIPAVDEDSEEEEQVAPVSDVGKTVPKVEPELLARAEALGFSKEEAVAFGDRLGSSLDAIERRAVAILRGQGSPAKDEPSKQPETKEKASGIDIDKMFPATEFDEEFRKGVVAMGEYYEAIVGDVSKKYDALHSYMKGEQDRRTLERYDGYIASLGKDWEPLFGNGNSLDLNRTGEAYSNRDRLFRAAEELAAVYSQSGRQHTEKELLEKAMRLEFGEKEMEIKERSLAARVQKRGKNLTARAGNRGADRALLSAEKRAELAVKSKLESMPGWDT